MDNVADPKLPDGANEWLALAAAVFGGVALRQFWGPLGAWIGRRLDVAQREHTDALSTCRKEIKALRAEFADHQERAAGIILKLTEQVARLETRLAEREADVNELRAELQRPRRRRLIQEPPEGG